MTMPNEREQLHQSNETIRRLVNAIQREVANLKDYANECSGLTSSVLWRSAMRLSDAVKDANHA